MRRILAIETSCDETAVASLEGYGGEVVEALHSQVQAHSCFGGVVPELASRSHLEELPVLLESVLKESGKSLCDFDAFAATVGPGLGPSLVVGAGVARGLAAGCGKRFVPVNHIEAHLLSPFFGSEEIPPHIGLVVSGGHTFLFDVSGFREYSLLGRTLDDAAGEAFDKVARMLGLGYPGGVEIDRLAKAGNPEAVGFPRAMTGSANFSFSGLKTAARVELEKGRGVSLEDFCASFQEAVVDSLLLKAQEAVKRCGRLVLGISGGVSSNSRLQSKARSIFSDLGVRVVIAAPELRTDNARMVGYVAAQQLARGDCGDKITADIAPNFSVCNFPGMRRYETMG